MKSAVVLGCTEWILEEFKTSLKFSLFFVFIFSSLLWHFVQEFWILRWKISPKWLNLLCLKTWKIQISNKFNFLKAVIVLGCPNTFLRGFEHFWETLRFFIFFHYFLDIPAKIFQTSRQTISHNYLIWWMENLEKSKRWEHSVLFKAVVFLACRKFISKEFGTYFKIF